MDTKGTQVRGFTLIELLVVIAIIAILAAVVVLTLNPAELLRQSRDSTRLSDMSALNSALSLYLADVVSVSLGDATKCYTHSTAATSTGCKGRHGSKTASATNTRAIDGTGWIPVDFTAISAGSPLPILPVDPVGINDATYFYSYSNTTTTYELDAKMESTKFKNGGGSDVESTDGGNDADVYEVGNEPGLDI